MTDHKQEISTIRKLYAQYVAKFGDLEGFKSLLMGAVEIALVDADASNEQKRDFKSDPNKMLRAILAIVEMTIDEYSLEFTAPFGSLSQKEADDLLAITDTFGKRWFDSVFADMEKKYGPSGYSETDQEALHRQLKEAALRRLCVSVYGDGS